MNRPRTIWLGFGLCLAVLLIATGWVSWTALRLNEAQVRMQRAAENEEKVRLALWRMDSMLAPMIAQESARPYYVYNSFYSANEVYGKAWKSANLAENLLPSPLLTQISTNIFLYFQIGPDGRITSPQVPEGAQRELAERQYAPIQRLQKATACLQQLKSLMKGNRAALATSLTNSNSSNQLLAVSPRLDNRSRQEISKIQSINNLKELENRSQSVQQALNFNGAAVNALPSSSVDVVPGPIKAVLINDSLILGRRLVSQGQEYVQGCWLDWPNLRQSLLDSVKDLCPAATLQISKEETDPQGRILASLPVRLIPGPGISNENAGRSPIAFILGLAWACMILATLAVAVLLHGVISLSERRAMFVSAVSHELRTPLTTFKMYSEMLASGMVPEESARRHYLNTLCSEANRLGHLVENVLIYARLERGSARANVENLTVGELLSRIQPRLEQRASQVGLSINSQIDSTACNTPLRIDVTAVEQILFNFVDNACKYAAGTDLNNPLHIDVPACRSNSVTICVRDHGPGLSADARRQLFQPFGKSAQEAAKTSPGVGLGLALCKRLARSLGGEIKLIDSTPAGTIFELRLPIKKVNKPEMGGASL